MTRSLCLLGATGSIGDSTLGVLSQHPGLFRLHSVAAFGNWEKMLAIVRAYEPEKICLFDAQAAETLSRKLGRPVLSGMDGLLELASDPGSEVLVNGLVGAVGCLPTIRAMESGKTIALANKETLVMAGDVIARVRKANPSSAIVPVDSEHNAVFQCLAGHPPEDVEEIQLTASGGPFRELPAERFASITVEDALRHPTWSMGRKITIDSSTLMNKGLEVIEAHHLFDVDYDRIRVVVHPQSIVHSMVQFRDGSLMAQLGAADMKIPIQCALTWPQRISLQTGRVDLTKIGSLAFYPPDPGKFPCLRIAYEAGNRGGTAPAALNAANEVLVAAFLERRISYLDIPKGIEDCLSRHHVVDAPTLEQVLESDREARELATCYIAG